jgi:hypothetical protein
MGGRSVRKGKDFERDVARQLAAMWEAHATRAAEALDPHAGVKAPVQRAVRRGLSQSRGGGAEEADVVVGNLDIHLEVKHDNGVSPASLMRQALGDVRASGTSTASTLVIGVLKRDRKEPEGLLFAWDAARLFAWWCGSQAPPRDTELRSYPGPVVRPYAVPFDAAPIVKATGGRAPKASRKTRTEATTRFDPRTLGPIVRLPWGELCAMLDAVWARLPRR